jgi:beta-lactam-binding protein with PASTA domain
MDDKNNFLNGYKKNMENRNAEENYEAPAKSEPQAGLRYEEKSDFVKPRKMDMGTPPPPRKRPKFLIPAIVGVLVILGAVIGVLSLLNRGVEVIDFTAWTKNNAQLWANEKGVKLQIEEEYNDSQETGKVVSQNIPKGSRVQQGDFIKLTVSLGHDLTVKLSLPDLKSMTKEEVEDWAAKNFMAKVRITAEFSDTVPSGKVISYEINDNTVVDEVTRNTPIYVVVSKGKEDDSSVLVTIPDFKEKTVSESYIFANENGLVLKVEEQYDDYVPKGSVMAQSVKKDEKVSRGTEVKLTVSKGKEITVPDFSDYSKEEAAAAATALGITATVTEKYSSHAAGDFISQSVPADSEYEEGEIVELNYSIGNKIVLASYVGQARDAIETWAKDLNDKGAKITIKTEYTKSNSAKGMIIHQDKANTVIGYKTTIHITVSKGKIVYVPDFKTGYNTTYDKAMTREEALALCESLNIVPVFVKASNSDALPGAVWSQSISAGTEISEGTSITLKYAPNKSIQVPSFDKMTKEQASAYCKMLDIKFETADANVAGYDNTVCKQSINAHTTVASGTAITLTISPAP